MAGRRTLIAALAVVLGLVAGAAVYVYLHDVQQRAYHNAQMTSVYVVKKPIAAGTTATNAISSGLIAQEQIPRQFRPSDAVTDLASIRGETAGSNLSPGQVLVSGLFVTPTVLESPAVQAIPKGDVAITISADQVHEVAGLVQPGDKVDLLVMLSSGSEEFLYQNVPVLAVGSTVTPPAAQGTGAAAAGNSSASVAQKTASAQGSTASSSASSNWITFAVPPQAAERIAFAASGGGGVQGSIYLALVPAGAAAAPVPPVSQSNLIPSSPTP